MTVRTFVALELSEEAEAGILTCIEELRRRGIRASWARRSTIHLTIRFLGDIEEDELERVIQAVERSVRDVRPFEIATKALGAFPSPARPRVVWIGIDAPDELYELHSALERELEKAGYRRERRRFHPHVTLGRLRRRERELETTLGEVTVPAAKSRVDSVRVMKSTLAPSGAIHEVMKEISLRQGDQSERSPHVPG